MTKPKNPEELKTVRTKYKILKTLNKMSQYTREVRCPYCDLKNKLEFEKNDPLNALREITKCDHLVDYNKYIFKFAREGWEVDWLEE